ncbi:hypothetical protein BS50DRAFT_52576 [Corynespora cassiicola Philippines]|uniref:Uncharacterized protein n=1 Tax=Corynespora cassiicola Philippines TaxID=1448308 RepID=A0A2T2NID6_CORCC|nr:hypothetical protein BS50DRAFT_52576 [Corynespora cassiicola Philippines]
MERHVSYTSTVAACSHPRVGRLESFPRSLRLRATAALRHRSLQGCQRPSAASKSAPSSPPTKLSRPLTPALYEKRGQGSANVLSRRAFDGEAPSSQHFLLGDPLLVANTCLASRPQIGDTSLRKLPSPSPISHFLTPGPIRTFCGPMPMFAPHSCCATRPQLDGKLLIRAWPSLTSYNAPGDCSPGKSPTKFLERSIFAKCAL